MARRNRLQKGAEMLKLKHRFYLQAFAEGFDGAEGASDTEGSTDSGLANQSGEDSDLFSYGGDESPTVSPNESGTETVDEWSSIREKYKDRIGEEIQGAIQKRFKNQQSFEDNYNDLLDGLAPLFLKYKLDISDVEGLKNALATDDTLLEDTAFDEGLTPEAVRERLMQQRENARLQKELERLKEEQMEAQASKEAYDQYNSWVREAEELKQLYPNFDLATELENEEFRDDLINSGKPLRKAYESAHLDEIIQGAIQTTASKVRESVTNNIKARGMRPSENGTRGGSVSVKKNVNELTDKDIDRIYKRVKMGDTISF
jgi:hypothetical protein